MEDLNQNAQFEKKITTLCSFNNVKCSFKQGKILTIKNTNISFIQPHQIEKFNSSLLSKIKHLFLNIIYT